VKQLLSAYFLVLFSGFLPAQNPVFHRINDENGLPSNEVYSIMQDHHGFIWFGCDAGLYRYNGVKFIQYQNVGQRSAAITGLTLSGDSVIYCYNFSNQIFFVQGDSLHELKSWQGKSDKGFTNITVDAKNRLWASSPKYLYCFNRQLQLWDSTFLSDNSFYPPANIISGSSGKQIWSSLYQKILSIENDILTFHAVEFEKNDDRDLSAQYFVADDSIVWSFSRNGARIYQNATGVFKQYFSSSLLKILKGKKITYLKAQGRHIFIATYSGFIIHDRWNDQSTLFFEKESFSNYLQDKEGNIWLTTLQNGVYFIPQMNFMVWDVQQSGIPENRITDLFVTDSKVYFSMLNGHIGVLNKYAASFKSYYIGLKSDIRAIFFSEALQTLYFNSSKDLYQLKEDKLSILRSSQPPLKRITKADGYYVFCSSFGTDIYRNINATEKPTNIAKGWCRDAAYLNSGQLLFIATNDGVIRCKFTNGFFANDTLLDVGIQYKGLYADERTKQIIALNFKGKLYDYSLSPPRLIASVPADVVPTDVVLHNNKYFVATNKGLWIYNIELKQWSNVNRISGLASNDIVSMQVDADKLWLATSKGLQCIPLGYEVSKQHPKIVLREIIIDGKKSVSNFIKLNYNSKLAIGVEAIAYASLQNFQFAYRFKSSDTNWVMSNAINDRIFLSGIPPGDFTVEIKVIDYLGRFSDNTVSISGKVIPPFWQRWWFYVLVAASGITFAYFGFLLRIKSLRIKQQQAVVKLTLENELKLSQQTALKAQMNPHFLFNVLNSIKSFIYENDKKSATEYLSKFAELVRGILTMSSQPKVKLSDEVKALELYIQLEAMLLEPPFNYTLNIDKNLDVEAISIPSLIIQPFVENAFKHGLRHKQGEKTLHLRIDLNKATNLLKVSIEDNGIGRKKSAELNTDDSTSHQSFATTANTKRLALLNRDLEEKVSVLFVDKIDENRVSGGTIVVLNIKI